jgi:hypothetical protein
MFDKLFKYSAAVTRHQNGPHAQSREQFLKKMLDDGLALPTIRRTAWALLAVADTIGVSVESITEEGLDNVLSRPFRRRAPVAAEHSTFTVKLLRRVGRRWLRSVGALAPDAPRSFPFSTELDVFREYMRLERGLSSATITNRTKSLCWFFSTLPPDTRSLERVTIAHNRSIAVAGLSPAT